MPRDAILVTGGAGFIGANFCRFLKERTNYVPICLDRFDEFSVARPDEFVDVVRHDLSYPVSWERFKLATHTDFPSIRYVVHMAAGSHVDRSITDPMTFVRDNVLGTLHLLEFVRSFLRPERTLYFSTDEVFGPASTDQTFGEFSRHDPNNPYAASKSGAEQLCPAYANTYGMPITVSHCSNVYGPRQHLEKFIPLCIDKIMRGETIQIHARDGVPSSRIYIHVTDVCRAIMTLLHEGDTLKSGAEVGRYNIAGGIEYSNLEVAQTLARLLGKPLHYELAENVANRPRHDQRYAISWDRLHALGWEPRIELEQGLKPLCDAAREAA